MSSAEIRAAVTNLKRHDQWRLRNDPSIPELLAPAAFLPEEERWTIFSGNAGPLVKKLISHKKHKTAILRYSMADHLSGQNDLQKDLLCQIYTGGPVHNSEILIGRIGCVDLIRRRLLEELSFIFSRPIKLSMDDFADYVSSRSPEAGKKFLYRLNSGQMV